MYLGTRRRSLIPIRRQGHLESCFRHLDGAVISGTRLEWEWNLTGDVDDVRGILSGPKGVHPSAPHVAGCDACPEIGAPYDDGAFSRRTHADIKKAEGRGLNGVASDRGGEGEEMERLLGIWTVEMSYRGRGEERYACT